ncbi:probable isoprenylcysteine alpha-carbonyl methylesterase ICMEL2 isoform X3 [Aristolochia californica]|uniref:probable isoprenylcysteine alpha-carbonyl methylesterase ICMEL2 isoform X3 n=1 Tax=Aristolochia californica TaxID=171875 RepID=UPI0035D9DD25
MQSKLLVPSSAPSMPTVAGKDVALDIYQKKDLALEACSSSSPSSIEDESIFKPFIGRMTEKSKKNRRRTCSSGSLTHVSPSRQQSFPRDVGHAAAETYLLTRLSFKLLAYLGLGYWWIIKFLALNLYAMLLLPGFLQVICSWILLLLLKSGSQKYSLWRSAKEQHACEFVFLRLDLYLPANLDEPKPVVAFITGGAWIIGNFPQGTISDMVKDVSSGISFVCNNIAEFGGDPNRIYLIGQSAGAHIAACTLLDQAFKESGEGESVTWSISQIKAYFGISGGYNILNLVDHFHSRGLYRSILLSIMEGEQYLHRFSPEIMVLDRRIKDAISCLPFIVLFHGTADYSIPSDASKTFANALQKVGAKVGLILYEGKTHTDLCLQDPLRGGRDELVEDIVAVIHAGDTVALAKDAEATHRRRLVPEYMLKLAHNVSPF